MEEKIRLTQAVVVEGKYDKIKLSSLIEGTIIKTDGFQIYKDRQKIAMIKTIAEDVYKRQHIYVYQLVK